MSDDIIKTGDDAITAGITIISYTDRPGVSKVYVGNTLLFDAQDQPIQQLEIRMKMPFHLHFTQPVLMAVWKEPT